MMNKKIQDLLIGTAVGEAIGGPNFNAKRARLDVFPVFGFRSNTSLEMPPGTWGNKTSFALCFSNMLTKEFGVEYFKSELLQWYYEKQFTPFGQIIQMEPFTKNLLIRLTEIPRSSLSNMNESCSPPHLVWSLPAIIHLREIEDLRERFWAGWHFTNWFYSDPLTIACSFYLMEFGKVLYSGYGYLEAYNWANDIFRELLKFRIFKDEVVAKFQRLLSGMLYFTERQQIISSANPIHILESAIWSLMNSSSFDQAILKAVNLGGATDITGSVTGALAGLLYGTKNMSEHQISKIPNHSEIMDLGLKVHLKYNPVRLVGV